MSNKKDDIIENIYNEFYGSIQNTLKDARKIDPKIKYEDVKEWYEKNLTKKKNLKGYNSYIADYPYQEYQMDLFFINDAEKQDFNIGLLMIDIFTKFISVIPLKTKLADDVLQGIKEAISNMGHNPEMLYTDDEGSFHSKDADKFYKAKHIKHIITRSHATYAERAIRTIKDMIYKRLEKSPDENWYSHKILYNALFTYNYKNENSISGMTPSDAKKPENIFQVKAQLEIKRVKKRKYPDVSIGDYIRIYTKKKNFQKERIPVWSNNKYKVIKIEQSHGQNFYHIEGRDRSLLRHEILLQK
jgi:hypothetical protein